MVIFWLEPCCCGMLGLSHCTLLNPPQPQTSISMWYSSFFYAFFNTTCTQGSFDLVTSAEVFGDGKSGLPHSKKKKQHPEILIELDIIVPESIWPPSPIARNCILSGVSLRLLQTTHILSPSVALTSPSPLDCFQTPEFDEFHMQSTLAVILSPFYYLFPFMEIFNLKKAIYIREKIMTIYCAEGIAVTCVVLNSMFFIP